MKEPSAWALDVVKSIRDHEGAGYLLSRGSVREFALVLDSLHGEITTLRADLEIAESRKSDVIRRLASERDEARRECTEQREAKEAAYAELYKARGFILADEERRKLTGDALYAEAGPTDHAAVYAVVSVIAQRDALAVAAKEYLMRSVPDPNTGRNAEETLREILAHLDAEERDEP